MRMVGGSREANAVASPQSKLITSLFSVSLLSSLPLPSPFPISTCLNMNRHPSPPTTSLSLLLPSMAALDFEDLLPVIAHKLGGQGLLIELCNGFQLLMDKHKGLITVDSLRTNSALLGLQELTHDDLRCMIAEADLDGDGALSLLEFCVLMFRLSPDLMQHSSLWLHQPLQRHLPNSSSS